MRDATMSLATLALCVGLGGCAAPAPVPSPTAGVSLSVPTAAPSASASPTSSGPILVTDGTAADNLPLFAQVVASIWSGPDNASGRAYIDALTAAGFDKSAMQVTADTSTVGNRAESLMFSVLWADECLVGQVGPATGDPVAVVVPALAEGGCLIGDTRSIDW